MNTIALITYKINILLVL